MTYYRLHCSDAPEFSADNAWSAAWGEAFTADGSQYECRACDGTGEFLDDRCPDCSGEGVIDADRGYSCCGSASELVEYFDWHCPADDSDPVVEFDGEHVGNGLDGEPLVVPTAVVRWTTIGQLRGDV
jgi:hypothetical protein